MSCYFFNKIYLFVVLIVITTSCTSNLDFNQKTEDLSPFFEVATIFNAEVFNSVTSPTIPAASSTITYALSEQIIPFNIYDKLTDNGIVQNIKEVKFRITFNNTTNNYCSITVAFRTDSSTLNQYTSTINVPQNTTKTDIIFLESDMPNLISVTNIQITGFMTVAANTNPSGELSVKSDATIKLKL